MWSTREAPREPGSEASMLASFTWERQRARETCTRGVGQTRATCLNGPNARERTCSTRLGLPQGASSLGWVPHARGKKENAKPTVHGAHSPITAARGLEDIRRDGKGGADLSGSSPSCLATHLVRPCHERACRCTPHSLKPVRSCRCAKLWSSR